MHMLQINKNPVVGKLAGNQQGFASMVIGLVLILVLALMTVGFAQLARHEQQQALSHQLSTAAYYAAESGINDAVKSIQNGITNPAGPSVITEATTGVDSNTCLTGGGLGLNSALGSSAGVDFTYSCVMVSFKNDNLLYNPAATDSGHSTLTHTNGQIKKLTITWSSKDGKTTPRGDGKFAAKSVWTSPAVIQFSITPISAYNRQSLINNTYTAFLYPGNGPGTSASGSYGSNGQLVQASTCNTTCTSTIDMTGSPIPAADANGSPYLVHIIDLYDDSKAITISGTDNAGKALTFTGQPSVDVTGKAKNVLKRLRVRVSLDSNSAFNYALVAQDICKRIVTQPNITTFDIIPGAPSGACDPVPINNTPSPISPNGLAQIAPCMVNCSGSAPPPGGAYHWQHTFTNASPAGQDAITTGCTWTFTGKPNITTACLSGQPTPPIDFSSLEPPGFPPYPDGCHSISITATLTEHLSNGTNPVNTKKTNVPSCY